MLNQLTQIRSEKCVSSEKTQQTLNAFKNSARPRPLAARTKQPFILLALLFSLPVSFFLLWPTVLLAVCLCYTALYVKYIFPCMNFILDFMFYAEKLFLTAQLLKHCFIIKTPVWECEFFVYEDITLCLILQPLFLCFCCCLTRSYFLPTEVAELEANLPSKYLHFHTHSIFFSYTSSASQKQLKL